MKVKKAIIPAAGFGTRVLPATKAFPKELIPVVDKPAIQYIIEECASSGIEEVLIVTAEWKTSLQKHFEKDTELEGILRDSGKVDLLKSIEKLQDLVCLSYIIQGDKKGLGYAVSMGKEFVGEDPFAVLLPDELMQGKTPCLRQMLDVFENTGSAVIGVKEVAANQVSSYGIVDGEELSSGTFSVKGLVEKPCLEEAPSRLAIIGRYVLLPEIFSMLEEVKEDKTSEIQFTPALDRWAKEHSMIAKVVDSNRYDVGNKEGYLKAIFEMGLSHETLGQGFKEHVINYMKDINSK